MGSFQDSETVSAYAVEALQWAAGRGIVTGRTGSIPDPHAGAIRAETAVMFQRLLKRQA